MSNFTLSPETPDDSEAIERLNARVFGPGRFAKTAYRVRETTSPDMAMSFTARVGPLLVGANAMTAIFIGDSPAWLLGPLLREMEEEARVVVEGPMALHGLFHNVYQSPRDHVAVYVTRTFRVLGERAPDREIQEAKFFALDALPDGTTRATRARLAEILEGRPLSPTW